MARKDIFTASKDKKRKKLFLKMGLWAFGCLVFLSGLVYVLTLPKFTIQNISIEGNTSIASEDIEAEVKSVLQDKTLFFFKGDNIFFLSKNNIEKRLLEKFSRLKSVSVGRDFMNTLSVKTVERPQKQKERNIYYVSPNNLDKFIADAKKEPRLQIFMIKTNNLLRKKLADSIPDLITYPVENIIIQEKIK